MTPYVGLSGEVAVVQPIIIDECCVFIGPDSVFYARSVTPTIGGLVGATFAVAPHVAFGMESGIRYQQALNPDLSDLRLGPWVNSTFAGRRWSIPVTGVARFRF